MTAWMKKLGQGTEMTFLLCKRLMSTSLTLFPKLVPSLITHVASSRVLPTEKYSGSTQGLTGYKSFLLNSINLSINLKWKTNDWKNLLIILALQIKGQW